jgi:predicted mannosyl-3-phosphoglycerate phosphatase (HAD superfamily)
MLASLLPVAQSLPSPASVVVITDVDGVLRHAGTRSLAEAGPALASLAATGTPVVLCSDHSPAELMRLQREAGLRHPFICEGGAALYVPGGYFCDLLDLGLTGGDWEVVEFGPPRAEVTAALRRSAEVSQVAVVMGRDLDVDEPSSERLYTEPFRIQDVGERAATRLFTVMRGTGFRCISGPRCHLATGVPSPAHAVRLLMSLYRAASTPPVIIGVGGDWRDRALLREVDAAVIVRNPAVDQSRLLRKVPAAYYTDAEGPAGWTEAILGRCPAGRA